MTRVDKPCYFINTPIFYAALGVENPRSKSVLFREMTLNNSKISKKPIKMTVLPCGKLIFDIAKKEMCVKPKISLNGKMYFFFFPTLFKLRMLNNVCVICFSTLYLFLLISI